MLPLPVRGAPSPGAFGRTGVTVASVVLALFAASACSPKLSTDAPPAAVSAAPAAVTSSSSSATSGSVVGRGPKPGSGGSVVVVLEPKTERTFPPQTEMPVMDQVGLAFAPELLIVRTGQPAQFRNNDDTLHNVHVGHEETREPAFNVAIPTSGAYDYTFVRDGFYRVGCDIHPAMAGAVFAASSPFAALAKPDGSFVFAEVPAGAWTVKVYASGRILSKDVDVKAGQTNVTVE